jgi:hypothetical protein
MVGEALRAFDALDGLGIWRANDVFRGIGHESRVPGGVLQQFHAKRRVQHSSSRPKIADSGGVYLRLDVLLRGRPTRNLCGMPLDVILNSLIKIKNTLYAGGSSQNFWRRALMFSARRRFESCEMIGRYCSRQPKPCESAKRCGPRRAGSRTSDCAIRDVTVVNLFKAVQQYAAGNRIVVRLSASHDAGSPLAGEVHSFNALLQRHLTADRIVTSIPD